MPPARSPATSLAWTERGLRERRVFLPFLRALPLYEARMGASLALLMTEQAQTGRRGLVRGILVDLAVMTVIGVVLALVGPFGSFNDPLAIRLMVWVGFAWLGYVLYAPIDTIAQRLAPALDLPAWGLRIAACMIASIPMAVAVWAIPRWPDRLAWPGLELALEHYLYVVVIGGLITVVNTLIQRQRVGVTGEPQPTSTAAPPSPSSPPAPPAPRFLDRLPPELGSELIALEMEDHYVRAHTALGSELVLLRMGDAIAELDGIDGRQVHRSWWVARAAVEDVRREGRNVRLALARGIEAPVSRAKVSELKDAGWI